MSKLRPSKGACLFSTMLLFAGCETVPALVQLGVAFGNDMISAAAHNYAPQYAGQVESLFSGIASNITGLQFGAEAASGVTAPEDVSDINSTVYPAPEATVEEEEQQQAFTEVLTGSALATNLLVLRAGASELSQVRNGDRLFDGGATPQAGDKLKIHFRANCECYVYVIGVDSTGFVAQIFPDPDEQLNNPVSMDQDYVLPGGDYWWGLDQTSGVEHVYFIASREPRYEIESALTTLAAQPRRVVANEIQPVYMPVLLNTRGLVKVLAPVAEMPPQALAGFESSLASTPLSSEVFTARNLNDDIMVTKWFYHD